MLRPALLVLLFALVAPPALGQADKPEPLTRQQIADLSLDELLAALPEQAESRAGKAIEAEILERFNESGSPTVDLLMSWANQAIAGKQYPLALDILDQVVILKPDFAEAWNKRATVHFLADDYAAALADIRRTLALQPRHFGALSGLGLILDDTGHEEKAMEAFRMSLEINPLLDKVRESLERLEKEVAGNAI